MSRSSAKRRQRGDFKPKLIALSVAACFGLSSGQGLANPTGGTVGSGSATFASSGNTLTITNSANAIINWQSFSIGVNEITQFLQSSRSSAVLNRVVGANGVIPQSVIDGVLSSNGRVFLINSSGIVIGSSARIDVAGFVASSLNLSDRDFLNGRLRFTEIPGAGGVSNAGVIDTSSGGAGGRVFLVGPDVQNSGLIRSPQGEIVLAAGKSVELVSENSPFVTVHLTADNEQALNVGQLISDSGRIGMFGVLVRQGGVVEANSAVVGANGEVRLVATRDLTLDAGSRTTANGPGGGNVLLQAEGGTNLVSGTVEAKGSSGQGGTIQALGVRVGVIGHGVIDASGDAGGGTVLVGGDAHGANRDVQNAQQTVIGSDGIIRADAGTTGDGGRVIVWSDESTKFFGSISARGGSQGGNGGFAETSGKALQAFGRVDTSAPNGNGGEWLLDPQDIYIALTGIDQLTCLGGLGVCFDDPGLLGLSQISAGTIDTGLRTNGSVTLQAHHDINLQTNLNLSAGGGSFTAQAGNNINLGGDIIVNGTNVVLRANDPASNSASGVGSIISAPGSGNITTNGGSVNLLGYGVAVGNINTSGGALGVGGGVKLATEGGNVTVNGIIDTHGVDGSANGPGAGSRGGDVTIESLATATSGTVAISGGILSSGGNGATVTVGQGGPGGSAGNVLISSKGQSVTVGGNILANGGAGGNAAAGSAGGNGGAAGTISISGDAGSMGPISAIGGNGGTGSAIGLGGAGGKILISTPGNIALGGAINAYGGLAGAGITRACCGLIEIVAGGAVTQAALLTTDSLVATGTDVKLDLGNAVKSLQGSASNGNFVFNNSGNLELDGVSASRLASISATGNITGGSSAAGLPLVGISTSGSPLGNAVQGGTGVTLNAGGAIGSTTAPLVVAAPALAASAAYGIAIDLNALGPTPTTVNTLQNSTTGDILLNAHGGTTIASLVSSPGSVTINSFSPLDVQQGITAGGGIFLSTGGVLPNDMTLTGTFSPGTGPFDVTIGSFGTLHLAGGLSLTAPLFPNPLNITQFTFVSGDPLANTIVAAAYNATAASRSLVAHIVEEPPTKDKRDDKRAAAICR